MGNNNTPAGKERRDTPRVPIALHAIVKMTGRPFQLFRTRDLSLEGAFVETGPHRLVPAQRLEVALKIPSKGTSQVYRFNAHVIRVAPGGVGMMFDHVDTESYAALLECVFTTRSDATV